MKMFKKFAVSAALALAVSTQANAAVITSLPGGSALAIPVHNVTFISTPHVLAPGIVSNPAPGSTFTPGYTGGYGFGANGSWSGVSMIGLDQPNFFFDIDFAAPIQAFLGELNWTVGATAQDASISIFGASGLLESLTLENASGNAVAPGFYGFSRASSEITKVRFSNEFIGVRNISISSIAAVPEPASWALMIAGFGLVGSAMRRRKPSVSVSFA